METRLPNPAAPGNGAMARLLNAGRLWRAVPEQHRSAISTPCEQSYQS